MFSILSAVHIANTEHTVYTVQFTLPTLNILYTLCSSHCQHWTHCIHSAVHIANTEHAVYSVQFTLPTLNTLCTQCSSHCQHWTHCIHSAVHIANTEHTVYTVQFTLPKLNTLYTQCSDRVRTIDWIRVAGTSGGGAGGRAKGHILQIVHIATFWWLHDDSVRARVMNSALGSPLREAIIWYSGQRRVNLLECETTKHFHWISGLPYSLEVNNHTESLCACLPLSNRLVTICTTSLTFNNSTFCPHSVFLCFVWISEKTAIISLYNINWLVFITEI